MKKKEKKPLVTADAPRCFWVHNGRVVCNLRELHDALKNDIDAKTFEHHVNTEKNDFEDWIRNVLGDSVCADGLAYVKTRRSACTVINKALKEYE